MPHSGSPVVKVQVEVSFPESATLRERPFDGGEQIVITIPSDGQTCPLSTGNTLTVQGTVTPSALATQTAMNAWLTNAAGTTLALAWQPPGGPPPPPPGSFTFALSNITDPTFVNHWVVLNVTAEDSTSGTLLGKSISVKLTPSPVPPTPMPRERA